MDNPDITMLADIEAVRQISIVPVILEAICTITGMGFAAVARVTKDKWVACEVKDEIKFGLMSGGELRVDTTICHEIRQSGNGVIIDNVDEDEYYCRHHTPAMYGFKSYISIPIILWDGSFFGTLCAIDPNPAILNTPEIIGMFRAYAQLISLCMNAAELLPAEEVRIMEEHAITEIGAQLNAISQIPQQYSLEGRTLHFYNVIQQSSSRIKELTEQLKMSLLNK